MGRDSAPADMMQHRDGAAGSGDADPPDDGIADDARPTGGDAARSDARPAPEDVGVADAAVRDRGLADMSMDAGADREPADAARIPLPYEPDPACAPNTPIEADLPGGFELVEAPLGLLKLVGDIDGDGRVELFAQTRNLVDQVPAGETHRAISYTIFTWDPPTERIVDDGEFVGIYPFAVFDLEGTLAMVGSEVFLDPQTLGIATTIGVRADEPQAPLRYDRSVQLFTDVDPRGQLIPLYGYGAPFDARPLDGDGDGLIELLTFAGYLLEWRGDRFERVWSTLEADPRDERIELGGGAFGRVTHGDFDGDGATELVIDGYAGMQPIADGELMGYAKHARIFENRGDDAYELTARLPYGALGAQFSGSGDLDGDGRPEFLFGGSLLNCLVFEVWTAVDDDRYVRLARIDYVSPAGFPTDDGATAFGDLDGDGDAELVINLGDTIAAWDWDGLGLRQILGYRYCEACAWSGVWTGDLEGDGVDEIFFAEFPWAESRVRQVLSPTGVRILRRSAD